MGKLEIPAEALETATLAVSMVYQRGMAADEVLAREMLQASAHLIVAAELERLATWAEGVATRSHGGAYDAMSETSLVLRRRAEELKEEDAGS